MPVQLNHTIIWCNDQVRSAHFLTDILGLPEPHPYYGFLVVDLANGVSLDFYDNADQVAPQHYAFLVSEEEFDVIHQRILDRGLTTWADPARTQPNQINRHDGGRGVYFQDPDGHLLEIITRPYGSEGS